MRAFFDILSFEWRYQLKSPLLLGVLVVFFLLHLFAVTSTGINLGDNHLVHVNSPYLVLFTELVFNLFILLPIIFFVLISIIRDHDYHTAEFFFTTPTSRTSFFLGRFAGSLLPVLLIALAGILGSLSGPFTPLVEPDEIGPFTLTPYLYTFFVFSLPNFFIAGCFFFSIAALTRSTSLTVAGVIAFMAADLWLNTNLTADTMSRLALLDPFGGLAFQTEIRYWTVAELNSRLPIGLLPANRLLWMALALGCLLFSLYRFRMDMSPSGFRLPFKRRQRKITPSRVPAIVMEEITSQPETLRQFLSQLRMDLACVLKSPLFYILILAAINATTGEFRGNVSPIMDLPLYPLTSNMLGFFRFGLIMSVMVIAVYYSGTLVHRERDCMVHEMMGALPYPGGIMVMSKTLALCLTVTLFMLTAMVTSMVLQALAGYTNFELGVYLQSLFIHNGPYYYMLCVLAVFIQVLCQNKWLGMLLTFVIFAILTVFPVLGFEHLLVNFSLPYVIYSDMNGFGHFTVQILSLIVYWGAFCGGLLIAGHLLFPRGCCTTLRERMTDARSRISGAVRGLALTALLVFTGAGGWIFYNTNLLNEYFTSKEALQLQADYEKAHGAFENAPAPSFLHIDFSLDLYPEERRLASSGSAVLRNNKATAINEFVLSMNAALTVDALEVESATLVQSDPALGFYLFAPDTPLAPGKTVTVTWRTYLHYRGFAYSVADTLLVENGTYISSGYFMPIPGFNKYILIKDNRTRAEYGLPPKARKAALGDPEYLDEITGGTGIDSRATMHAVISTAPDQIAVTPGKLQRQWMQDGRSYFEYAVERPVWPLFSINSARYEVARRQWNGVDLEIYYHPGHAYSVEGMLNTAQLAMDFYNRSWGDYQFPWFRIVEYARYKSAANPFAGTVPYSEAIGFITDLSAFDNIDYGTIHELAHMWWGHRVIGANMQGRQFLNEGMAEYASLMFLGETLGDTMLRRMVQDLSNRFLASRKSEKVAELPLMYTEDQANLSYGKGPLVMHALTDVLGKDRINRALNSFIDRFGLKPPPFPTSRDFVEEIRAVAGPEHQDLITDLFEKIVLYDVQVTAVSSRPVSDGYDVTIDYTARKYEADGQGVETEVPLDLDMYLGVFSGPKETSIDQEPLYLQKHRIQTGEHSLTVRVPEAPGSAGINPFRLFIDRTPDNNISNSSNSVADHDF
jgi:ABC-type transport system involved in multi-copper enzyme maturation permease subunit